MSAGQGAAGFVGAGRCGELLHDAAEHVSGVGGDGEVAGHGAVGVVMQRQGGPLPGLFFLAPQRFVTGPSPGRFGEGGGFLFGGADGALRGLAEPGRGRPPSGTWGRDRPR